MGEGITHIISPSSAVWCSWIMLALMLCGIMSELFQPGVVLQAKNSLLAQSDRLYKESPNNFMGQLMITLFRIGVITMAVYLCCPQPEVFSFTGFGVIAGIVITVTLVKMICNACIDYTFSLSRRFGSAYEHYANIITLTTLLAYPALLVLLRYGNPIVNRWVFGCIAGLFVLLWFYRAGRQFVSSPKAFGYLLIYCCTVEILPWILIYMLSEQTLTII